MKDRKLPLRTLPFTSAGLLSLSSGLLCLSTGLLACGGAKHDAQSKDDTFIPQETQRRSEKNYGQQQGMMEDLGATSAERAAARHDAKVRDARDPQDEED